MIHKIVFLFGYMVIFPMCLGLISQTFMWRNNLNGKLKTVPFLLDCYVSGILSVLFIFEIAGQYVLTTTQSFSIFISSITKIYMVIFGIAFLLMALSLALQWNSLFQIDEINIKDIRERIVASVVPTLSVGVYILIAVGFIAQNAADDTLPTIVTYMKNDWIAVFNPYTEVIVGDIQGHTKLIEIFYAFYADMIGIGVVQFVEYILDFFLLVFFFLTYKRIERIFLYYNSALSEGKAWVEIAFISYCIALFFIDGSLIMSIPQNIWNGTTLLASCVFPLCFIYGYAAICEMSQKHIWNSVLWLLRIIVLMPVAAVLHDHGLQFVVIIVLIIIVAMVVNGCIVKMRILIQKKGENK